MYEFAVILPVFLLILLGMLEFGLAFNQNLTLESATREGARVGAALVNGGGTLGCLSNQSPNAATVDPLIIAAVERILASPGSQVDISKVTGITIYHVDTDGKVVSGENTWTPGAYTTPVGVFPQPLTLKFTPGTTGWEACSRTNAPSVVNVPPDSVGVAISYNYVARTPLGGLMRLINGGSFDGFVMSDRTVMQLEPTNAQ